MPSDIGCVVLGFSSICESCHAEFLSMPLIQASVADCVLLAHLCTNGTG